MFCSEAVVENHHRMFEKGRSEGSLETVLPCPIYTLVAFIHILVPDVFPSKIILELNTVPTCPRSTDKDRFLLRCLSYRAKYNNKTTQQNNKIASHVQYVSHCNCYRGAYCSLVLAIIVLLLDIVRGLHCVSYKS